MWAKTVASSPSLRSGQACPARVTGFKRTALNASRAVFGFFSISKLHFVVESTWGIPAFLMGYTPQYWFLDRAYPALPVGSAGVWGWQGADCTGWLHPH